MEDTKIILVMFPIAFLEFVHEYYHIIPAPYHSSIIVVL